MLSVMSRIGARNNAQVRNVVEGKTGETIEVPEGSGLFITGCTDCTINAPGTRSKVTIHRCEGTIVRVGNVIASLELINCKAVDVTIQRCRTITVDTSEKITLTCQRQAPPASGEDEEAATPEQEAKRIATAAADGASAVRLFTSSSEDVSVSFEGLFPDGAPVEYLVPKDFKYEHGDGPRSVSRISVNCSGAGGGECKTLRCDQFGMPLEMVEAAQNGDGWSWEDGRVAAESLFTIREKN